jgi:hypothetical protein
MNKDNNTLRVLGAAFLRVESYLMSANVISCRVVLNF